MTQQGTCDQLMSRRESLWRLGSGIGGVALAYLLDADRLLATAATGESPASCPMPHHAPKARRIVQLFLNGGMSQMDTFDYKPELERRHGEKFDPGAGVRVEAATSAPGNLMKCPFEFRQHGECGRWVSSVFPQLSTCVDQMAFLMALSSKTNVHGPASYMMNTGFILPGFPCMGAWISYGLGRLCDNLPTFVVLPDARGLPYNQQGNFASAFLPVTHQGTVIQASSASPIPNLFPAKPREFASGASNSDTLEALARMNRRHAEENRGDSRLEARIESYELAARMQLAAPEALDLAAETDATRRLYGIDDKPTDDFGRRCLLARRLLERGVRFVQVWSGAGGPSNNWDNHSNIHAELPAIACQVDQPIAGLLHDLEQRGLLDDTLVVCSTEFGRMPFTQGATGRDHNGGTSVAWLAGGGVRGGCAYGQSDDWSWKAAENQIYCYDLHATILHLLGINHERLTFRHNGIDRRLTDVHGSIIHEILA
jgi:Protein of unknown function (DUF1501)